VGVTSVNILRQISGSYTPTSTSYDVLYAVTTNSSQDGPATVLNIFKCGKWPRNLPTSYNMTFFAGNAENGDTYRSPGTQKCDGTAWDNPSWDFDKSATIVNAQIVERDTGGTNLTRWVVRVTYGMDYGEGTPYSGLTITPYYIPRTEDVIDGTFQGIYNKKEGTEDNCGFATKGSRGDSATLGNVNEAKKGGITNSNLIPFVPALQMKKYQPAFKLTWPSFNYLDFSQAINKVNEKELTLDAYNAPEASPAAASGYYDTPTTGSSCRYAIFSKKFKPRELLVYDHTCRVANYQGHKYYENTVNLLFDRCGNHDKFVLDRGYSFKGGVNDPDGRGSRYNNPPKDQQSPTVNALDRNTNPVREKQLLDGNGGILKSNSGSTRPKPYEVVYIRYRIHDEIDFFTQNCPIGYKNSLPNP